MLQEGTLTSTDRNRLKIIESQLDRLTDSVKNLLSSTRQPKPLFKPLEVNDILVELIHLSEPWLHARNVKLLSALSAALPPVLGDATRLQTSSQSTSNVLMPCLMGESSRLRLIPSIYPLSEMVVGGT
jgi:signal transduction histidine kinase